MPACFYQFERSKNMPLGIKKKNMIISQGCYLYLMYFPCENKFVIVPIQHSNARANNRVQGKAEPTPKGSASVNFMIESGVIKISFASYLAHTNPFTQN